MTANRFRIYLHIGRGRADTSDVRLEVHGTTPNMIPDHDPTLRSPGNLRAASTHGSTSPGARQYLVLKRHGRWCIKSLGRFSAPYSSEATAIGAAIERGELAAIGGRGAVVALFTRTRGFTTIKIVEKPSHAAA